jgi:TPR repeat protein
MRRFLTAAYLLCTFASSPAPAQTLRLDPVTVARANSGDPGAEYEIGQTYFSLDDAKAAGWFRKAADQGNKDAQTELAFFYQTGRGVTQDYAQAAKWYKKAAIQGDKEAQYETGLLLETGVGVSQDDAQAIVWFRKAAEQGHVKAQSSLGFMFYTGRGIPQDYSEAAAWCTKAAMANDADAQGLLGMLYGVGRGVPQNWVWSYFWLSLGASRITGGLQDQAIKARDIAASQITQDQLIQIQKLSREWYAKHPVATQTD